MFRRVRGLIRNSNCFGVLAGVCCRGFSIARRSDGGPAPLRNREHPWGFATGLTTYDTQELEYGNKLLRFSLQCFKICNENDVRFVCGRTLGTACSGLDQRPGQCWLGPMCKMYAMIFVPLGPDGESKQDFGFSGFQVQNSS